VTAIDAIRGHGLERRRSPTTGPTTQETNRASPTDNWFDVMVESALEGMRKPTRIYQLVCDRLGVPKETVPRRPRNLKPA
jgi:hypothetical protein